MCSFPYLSLRVLHNFLFFSPSRRVWHNRHRRIEIGKSCLARFQVRLGYGENSISLEIWARIYGELWSDTLLKPDSNFSIWWRLHDHYKIIQINSK